jgi:L-amino acid N-acyltransferase YncA
LDNLKFQKAETKDLEAILDLYNFYIKTTTVTFDHNPISMEDLSQRIFISHEKYQTYLICNNTETLGFCFLTQYRKKAAYDRTAEIGIYLKPEYIGKGIGRTTVAFLEKTAVNKRIKVILATISGENTASIKLFQRMGFKQCAHYKEIGEKFGRILDIVDYQRILDMETRSAQGI